MESLAGILLFIGFVILLFFGIRILIIAFHKSFLWGLACLILPFVDLLFVILHWDETKSPFLKALLAIPFLIGGLWLMETAVV